MTKTTEKINSAVEDLEKTVLIRELENKKEQISAYAMLIYLIRKELSPRPNIRPNTAEIERLIKAFMDRNPQSKAEQDAIELRLEHSKDFFKKDHVL